jgi:DNA-directed RNA polymerase subunit L
MDRVKVEFDASDIIVICKETGFRFSANTSKKVDTEIIVKDDSKLTSVDMITKMKTLGMFKVKFNQEDKTFEVYLENVMMNCDGVLMAYSIIDKDFEQAVTRLFNKLIYATFIIVMTKDDSMAYKYFDGRFCQVVA